MKNRFISGRIFDKVPTFIWFG